MLHLDKKSKQLIRSIDELKVVISGDERAEVDRQRMREKLKRDIEQQGLSEVEIQRLTTDRMQLDDQVRQHTAKLTETMQDTLNTEIELARAQVAAERLVDDYTGRATRLGVLPIPPAGFEDIATSFVQELNPSAAVASEIAPTAALSRIRPALLRMKTDVVNARKADVTAALEVEADLVQLSERVSDMLEHLERADERYGSIMDHLTSTKEVRGRRCCCADCIRPSRRRRRSPMPRWSGRTARSPSCATSFPAACSTQISGCRHSIKSTRASHCPV